MDRPIVLRKEAVERLLDRYYTGVPCKRGHLAERVTVTAVCTECIQSVRRDLAAKIAKKRFQERFGDYNAIDISNVG